MSVFKQGMFCLKREGSLSSSRGNEKINILIWSSKCCKSKPSIKSVHFLVTYLMVLAENCLFGINVQEDRKGFGCVESKTKSLLLNPSDMARSWLSGLNLKCCQPLILPYFLLESKSNTFVMVSGKIKKKENGSKEWSSFSEGQIRLCCESLAVFKYGNSRTVKRARWPSV